GRVRCGRTDRARARITTAQCGVVHPSYRLWASCSGLGRRGSEVIGSPAKRRGWVLVTALAVALAGCSQDSKSGSPRADASVTTTIATTSTTSPSDAVVAAWHRYWDVYVAVGSEMKLP